MTGATRRSSSEKHYQEPDIESLKSWRWYRKLSLFFNLEKNELDSYLLDIYHTIQFFFNKGHRKPEQLVCLDLKLKMTIF